MNKNYAFINCSVIDGSAEESKDNMIILVNDKGIIHKIGTKSETEIPSNYEIVDITNKYVMPGLINAHVHLFS